MKKFKKIIYDFIYSNKQIGLVFVIFALILLHLPSMIYGVIFFTPIKDGEIDYYAKFGAWFTTIGAIFTIINTVVVIFLMFWLHKKESSISLLPQITELRKYFTEIESVIHSEIDFFHEKQYEIYENIENQRYDNDPFPYQYDHVYRQEIKNLEEIIAEINELYSLFVKFKTDVNKNIDIELKDYQVFFLNINKLNEVLILKKPSIVYKKGFIDGSREEAEPDEIINAAQSNALESIQGMISIFENKALT